MKTSMTQTNLRTLFPMLCGEAEVLEEIPKNPVLSAEFAGWPENYRREFLGFCSGVRGEKPL